MAKKKTTKKKTRTIHKTPARSSGTVASPKSTKKSVHRKSTQAVPADGMGVNATKHATLDPASAGELIALRAFLKWQERGGDELSNWIDAEREVMTELQALASPGAQLKDRSSSRSSGSRSSGSRSSGSRSSGSRS